MKRNYHFEEYDPAWVNRYNEIADFLRDVFKDKIVSIDHVGSTSVPGMKAKPLIDAAVMVNPYSIEDGEKEMLAANGYFVTENAVMENSFLLEKGKGDDKTENIHVMPEGHHHAIRMLITRDYLRAHPDRVKAYSDLKDALKIQFPDDYVAYRSGKDAFMNETYELAKAWKGLK